jgi:hypothetical protein
MITMLRRAVSTRVAEILFDIARRARQSAAMIHFPGKAPAPSQSVSLPCRAARANSVGVNPVFALKRRVKWLCSE